MFYFTIPKEEKVEEDNRYIRLIKNNVQRKKIRADKMAKKLQEGVNQIRNELGTL